MNKPIHAIHLDISPIHAWTRVGLTRVPCIDSAAVLNEKSVMSVIDSRVESVFHCYLKANEEQGLERLEEASSNLAETLHAQGIPMHECNELAGKLEYRISDFLTNTMDLGEVILDMNSMPVVSNAVGNSTHRIFTLEFYHAA